MRIAVVRRNGLGDLITVMPLLALCKERYPGCHITLFVDQRNAPLLPYLQGFDDAVVIEPSRNKYISLFKTIWKQRHRRFDLAISARPIPMQWNNLFLAGLQTTRRRAVVETAWHSKWINEPLEPVNAQKHQMLKCLNILDPTLEHVAPHLMPSLHIKKTHNFPDKTLLVSVTNRRLGSQLDADKITSHLNHAFAKKSFHVVISCEPRDIEKAQAVSLQLKMSHQIIPTPNFNDFMGLLASVHGSWTGDGGIMHLMAAMDKPQLVLFGRTAVCEWAPLSKKAVCIWHPENVNFISRDEIEQGLEKVIDELR